MLDGDVPTNTVRPELIRDAEKTETRTAKGNFCNGIAGANTIKQATNETANLQVSGRVVIADEASFS